MPPPRARNSVLIFILITAWTLVLGVFLTRQRLFEIWWVHRLASPDVATRKHAALSLANAGTRKAIPALADGLGRATLGRGALDALDAIGKRAGPSHRRFR